MSRELQEVNAILQMYIYLFAQDIRNFFGPTGGKKSNSSKPPTDTGPKSKESKVTEKGDNSKAKKTQGTNSKSKAKQESGDESNKKGREVKENGKSKGKKTVVLDSDSEDEKPKQKTTIVVDSNSETDVNQNSNSEKSKKQVKRNGNDSKAVKSSSAKKEQKRRKVWCAFTIFEKTSGPMTLASVRSAGRTIENSLKKVQILYWPKKAWTPEGINDMYDKWLNCQVYNITKHIIYFKKISVYPIITTLFCTSDLILMTKTVCAQSFHTKVMTFDMFEYHWVFKLI